MEKRGVIVLGIPYSFTENELFDVFCECGKIEHCGVLGENIAGRMKDSAVVIFADASSVMYALNLNGRVVVGHSIRVLPITNDIRDSLYLMNLSYFKDPNAPDPVVIAKTSETQSGKIEKKENVPEQKILQPKTLVLDFLPDDVTEEEVREGCYNVGGIASISIMHRSKTHRRNSAFINFTEESFRDIALEKLRGCVLMRDNVVKVKPHYRLISVGDTRWQQRKSAARSRSNSFDKGNRFSNRGNGRNRNRSRSLDKK